ncbi:MAG: NIL domain-containing protein [Acidimicrobiales bacterium]
MSTISVRVKLTFPEDLVRTPVLARLVRRYDVEPNIRRANVEDDRGWILCELEGEAAAIEGGLAWLRDEGIGVDLLGDVLEG